MRKSSYTGTKIYRVPNVRGVRVASMQNERLVMGTTDLGLLDFSAPDQWEQIVPEGPYTNFLMDSIGEVIDYLLPHQKTLRVIASSIDRKGIIFIKMSLG